MKKFESDTLETIELYNNRIKALLNLNNDLMENLTINAPLSRETHEQMKSLIESSLHFAELVEMEVRYINRAFLKNDD